MRLALTIKKEHLNEANGNENITVSKFRKLGNSMKFGVCFPVRSCWIVFQPILSSTSKVGKTCSSKKFAFCNALKLVLTPLLYPLKISADGTFCENS